MENKDSKWRKGFFSRSKDFSRELNAQKCPPCRSYPIHHKPITEKYFHRKEHCQFNSLFTKIIKYRIKEGKIYASHRQI